MKSNYKRLGAFIEFYNVRAIELVENLDIESIRGISSISKSFIKTRANLVGVVADKYKVVTKDCFAYNPNTARMGDKIPIALNITKDIILVSSIYPTFRIEKTEKLDPEYLMMWFRRPEFDRYARYKSHGSAREVFDIDEMNELILPIPSIEKQQEIVREYKIIQNRITLTNQLITRLEETAQAIYKQWFVDFEFPDENGKPYKSNDGKMVWCEELEKEIPVGWEYKPFTTVLKLSGGGTPSTVEKDYWNGKIPFYTPGDLTNYYYSIRSAKYITELGLKKCSSKLYAVNTTFITARGATVGGVGLAGRPMAMNQTCYAVSSFNDYNLFAHQLTKSAISEIKNEAIGATFEALVTKNFDYFLVINPKKEIIINFEAKVKHLYQYMLVKSNENLKLEELKELLMAKMTKVED